MKRFILLLAFCASAHAQDVTHVIDTWKFALVDNKGTAVQELVDGKLQPVKRDTLDQCIVAGEIAFRKLGIETDKFACAPRYVVTFTARCSDTPPGPPSAIIGTKDTEGFKITGELVTGACTDDTRWEIKQVGWKRVPLAAGCWLKVETVLADCDGKVTAAPVDDSPEEFEAERGPWVVEDGGECPPEANGNCYFPPTVATRPCPAQGCYRDQVKP